jgi:hypothetical protein
MKYLKRFNEELNASTYRRAARKLKKKGHVKRANDLDDYANLTERKDSFIKWEELKDKLSSYGSYKLNISNNNESLTGDFYLDFYYPNGMLIDSYEPGEDNIMISIFFNIIPLDEDMIDELEDLHEELEFINGSFNGGVISFECFINNDSKIEIKEFNLDNFINSLTNTKITLCDRVSANRFKRLLINILNGKEIEEIYNTMEEEILMSLGFSAEYGFKIEKLAEYVNNISVNDLYKN